MPWVPDDIFEAMATMSNIVVAACRAGREHLSKSPTPGGGVFVGVIVDRDGNILGSSDGSLQVHIPPIHFSGFSEEGRAAFWHPDQHLSPKHAAALADVHLSTVKRAVEAGALPKPLNVSERRIVHKLDDVVAWIAGRDI